MKETAMNHLIQRLFGFGKKQRSAAAKRKRQQSQAPENRVYRRLQASCLRDTVAMEQKMGAL
jgi:predicted metalloprotease